MIKIGVIGIGNIGKRHIQSIGDLKQEKEIFCYDVFEESLNSLDNFLIENKVKIDKIKKFDKLDSFLDYIDAKTIIIIATTAKGRADLIEKTIIKNPKAIIVEKPVCQTLSEYERILKNYDNKVPIYVNFAKRCYPIYRNIKKELENSGKIKEISVHLNGLGMACVGIHLFDLITWLFDAKKFNIVVSELYETYKSKRKGFFDFTGKIKFLINESIKCELSNSRGGSVDCVRITTDQKIIDIYELTEKLIVISNDSVKVSDFKIPYQSQLTSMIINEILDNETTKLLPDIKEAFLPHKILFEMMQMNDIANLNIT